MICVSLGILLLHTKVRDGANKGKVERHFRTMKERWLYTLDIDSITSLAQFNGMLRDYMHSTPQPFTEELIPRLLIVTKTRNSIRADRFPENGLMTVFTTGLPVKSEKILPLPSTTYVWMFPCSLYLPKWTSVIFRTTWRLLFILFEEEKFPLRLTNRNENCHTKRNNLTIDYAKAGGAN